MKGKVKHTHTLTIVSENYCSEKAGLKHQTYILFNIKATQASFQLKSMASCGVYFWNCTKIAPFLGCRYLVL